MASDDFAAALEAGAIEKIYSGTTWLTAEVMTLAKDIPASMYERFGIRLEPEPVVV